MLNKSLNYLRRYLITILDQATNRGLSYSVYLKQHYYLYY